MADREQQGVPMPDPSLHDGVVLTRAGRYRGTEDGYTTIQLLAYGDAIAAAARREALEEAAAYLDAEHARSRHSHNYAAFYANGVRALQDKPQAEQGKESP